MYSDKMSTLLLKINESLELKYEYLRGLSGLHAKELRNITSMNIKSGNLLSKALKNSQTTIPIEGRVKDHLKANDHILCDVDSLDIWVKFKLIVDTPVKSITAELELKIDKDMTGKMLHNMVQKLSL